MMMKSGCSDRSARRSGSAQKPLRRLAGQSACVSLFALVGGLAAGGTSAQTYDGIGFAGQATVQSGNVTFSNDGNATDFIQIDSGSAIINWRPTDTAASGNINFLPSASAAQFTNNPSAQQDFTVLNRILPVDTLGAPVLDRTVELNGGITGLQYGGAGTTTGGNIYFYTPGGFLLGPTGAINAGSVILTTNDIVSGLTGGTMSFSGIANSTSAITISGQAQINAAAQGGYVALVAPRIVQAGTITSNGSIAYVAAEQADITINGGLFDIAISTGTTDANGIVHSGSSGGPASTPTPSVPDPQRVYMVAVPKNDALTMLLSGSMDYAAAASVAEEQSAVVLSAGYNVTAGNADILGAPLPSTSDIEIGAATFRSDMTALASGTISADPGVGTLAFQGAASLTAALGIAMRADDFGTISAAQSLNLATGTAIDGGFITLIATGSDAVGATPGQITVGGTLALSASVSAEAGLAPADGRDAAGGTIIVTADLGQINATGFSASATAFSEIGANSSGDARGGSVALSATRGGTLALGDVSIDTSSSVQFVAAGSPVNGGNASGGSVDISASGGGVLAFGDVVASAQATAGTATTGQAGSATAGNVRVTISDGAQAWTTFRGDVSAVAGFASAGGTFGGVTPGADGIAIDVAGPGSLSLDQSMSLYADALGYGGGAGGTAMIRASNISVRARDGGSIQIANDLFASATGQGDGALDPTIFDRTPSVAGGNIGLIASGGSFVAQGLTLDTSTYVKDSSLTAGDATAGNITIAASTPGATRGVIDLGTCDFGCLFIAEAHGGSGLAGSNAVGGAMQFSASDADLTMNGQVQVYAAGHAGVSTDASAGLGGNGTGGSISIASLAGSQGTALITLGTVEAFASGIADPGGEGMVFNSGDGGAGQGGTISVTMAGGALNATSLALSAQGVGGSSDLSAGVPYVAGNGTGGTVNVNLLGGALTLDALTIDASGTGGGVASSSLGGTLGIAGAGFGGTASFTASGGSLTANSVQIVADGTGGLAEDAFDADAGSGGNGMGGIARFTMAAGGTAIINATDLMVSAAGLGGNGGEVIVASPSAASFVAGNGGNGTGGQATISLGGGSLGGGSLTAGVITLDAGGGGGSGGVNGSAGNGGNAGSGTGGAARLDYLSEGHSIGTVVVTASGNGGVAGLAGTGNGGAGGNGTGGSAIMAIDVDPSFVTLTVSASGTGSAGASGAVGGAGGNGFGGTGGGGASLIHSFGPLDVSGVLSVLSTGTGGDGGNGNAGNGGAGGNGIGGNATLSLDGASTTLNSAVLAVSSNGSGGLGGFSAGSLLPGTRGGDGLGGAALFSASNGATALFQDVTSITAQGFAAPGTYGTGGAAGQGGSATGGSATLLLTDASLSMATTNPQALLLISAGARGGDSIGSAPSGSPGATATNGGDALGGTARFSATGSQAQLLSVRIDAQANGGQGASATADGGAGGNAVGGTSSFLGTGSALTLAGALDLDGSGIGGNGGFSPAANGGLGGAGTGGGATLSLAGGTLTAAGITACACGSGGTGGLSSAGPGFASGAGGDGIGGGAAFSIIDNAFLSFTSGGIAANGSGGAGGDGSTGGNGGAGTGGDIIYRIANARATIGNASGSYLISAQGSGGAGGIGGAASATGGDGGAGGSAQGGSVDFSADTADFAFPLTSISTIGTGGAGGVGGSGAANGASGVAGAGLGGDLALANSDNGTMAAGAVRQFQSLTLTAANLSGNGSLQLTDSSSAPGGGLSVATQLTLTNVGGVAGGATPAITISSTANLIRVGSLSSSSSRAQQLAFAGGGGIVATGLVGLFSGDRITINHASPTSPAADSLSAADLILSALGGITLGDGARLASSGGLTLFSGASLIGNGTLAGSGSVGLSVAGDLSLGGLIAGTTVDSVDSGGGVIQAGLLDVTGAVSIGRLAVGQGQTVRAASIAIGQAATAADLTVLSTTTAALGGTVGGNLTVTASGASFGTLAVGGNIAVDVANGGVTSGAITAGGSVQISSFNATSGGAITLTSLAAGDFAQILAGGALTVGTASAANDLILTSNGSALTAGSVTGGDDIWISAYGTAPAATLSVGTVTSTGLGNDNGLSGGATFGGNNNGYGPAGNVIRIRSSGTIATGNVSGGGRTILVADSGTISAGTLTGTQAVLLFSAGDVSTGGISSGGPLYVASQSMFLPNLPDAYLASSLDGLTPVSTTGNVTFGGPVSVGDAVIATTGNVSFTGPFAGGAVRILADGTVGGTTLSGLGAVSVTGNGGIALGGLSAGGATTLAAVNGDVAVTGNLASTGAVIASGRSVTLNATGALTLAQASATGGNVTVASTGALTVNGATATGNIALSGGTGVQAANLSATNIDVISSAGGTALAGRVAATNALRVTALGLAGFAGQASGQTVTVGSGDIAIAGGATLSAAGVLTLNASDAQRATFIGGGDVTSGYSLSGAEIARLFAGSIAVSAPRVAALASASIGSTRAPDVVLGSFTLNAGTGGNIGQNGTLTITTPGKLRVTGDVRMTGLGATGGLSLAADDALEVIAGSGSIDLRDGNGALAGLLSLRSADIIAATAAAITDVAATPLLTARTDRLGINDGVVIDEGMLRAGTIALAGTGSIFIQNVGATNAFAGRRGFTANSITLSTQGANAAVPTQIAINGRLVTSTGFATGLETIPLVPVNGAVGVAARGLDRNSTINGCLISGGGTSCTLQVTTVDNKDMLTAELDTDPRQLFEPVFPTTFVELRTLPQYGYPPLIDEPVTGAGNDDLWGVPCESGENCGTGAAQ
ncbi:hypothetical protein PX699_12310 [Sphingobium sp. H39-3-25]|uniref:beta strand repeat-containing protein n=1 Tax=Sphingobium arseniciresistens TaxID=3030834 RepID=UPI0023B8E9D6|nr:hypothetical protein [Sphingobium arseniciresistens]